jgi:hypothetical protein
MAEDTEHCFIYVLSICMSSENYIQFICLFVESFDLLLFSFLSSLYILDINLPSVDLVKICRLPQFLVIGSLFLDVKKLFNLMQSHLSILAHMPWGIEVLFRKYLRMLISSRVSQFFPVVVSMFQVLH